MIIAGEIDPRRSIFSVPRRPVVAGGKVGMLSSGRVTSDPPH